MTNIQPAGFVVTDECAIWGTGDTESAAWIAAGEWMGKPGVEVVRGASPFRVEPATAALIAQVQEKGGAIAWGYLPRGVCCTIAEEEAAT